MYNGAAYAAAAGRLQDRLGLTRDRFHCSSRHGRTCRFLELEDRAATFGSRLIVECIDLVISPLRRLDRQDDVRLYQQKSHLFFEVYSAMRGRPECNHRAVELFCRVRRRFDFCLSFFFSQEVCIGLWIG